MVRWAPRCAWLAGALFVASVSVGVYACLPDLPVGLCGNGRIDPGEHCDPGNNPNPGCDQYCDIVCTSSAGEQELIDSASDHCYFPLSDTLTYDDATAACGGAQKAHVVTFGSDDELEDVASFFSAQWKSGSLVWAGLAEGAGGYYLAAARDEPGWAPSNCGGCFLHGNGLVADAGIDSGPDAGTPYAVADLNPQSQSRGSMVALGRNVKAQVVCEREPVGDRSLPCNGDGSYCFELLATKSDTPEQSKRYLYNPTAMTASAAASYCAGLSVDGSPSLVVLESQAEREQLVYELTQLETVPSQPPPPTQFWVGLEATELVRESNNIDMVVWHWANGAVAVAGQATPKPTDPLDIWGDEQTHTSPSYEGSFAYINLNTAKLYDVGLGYTSVGDESTLYPFVCQYLY